MCTTDNLTHTFLLYTKATKRKGDERGCIEQLFPRKYPHYALNFTKAWAVWRTERSSGSTQCRYATRKEKNQVFVRKQLQAQHIWGSHNKPQSRNSSSDLNSYFIFQNYLVLTFFSIANVACFLFGFQSYIWEWISIFHWSFQRLADSCVLDCMTSNNMDKISTVIRTWLWSASKCFIPSVNPV